MNEDNEIKMTVMKNLLKYYIKRTIDILSYYEKGSEKGILNANFDFMLDKIKDFVQWCILHRDIDEVNVILINAKKSVDRKFVEVMAKYESMLFPYGANTQEYHGTIEDKNKQNKYIKKIVGFIKEAKLKRKNGGFYTGDVIN